MVGVMIVSKGESWGWDGGEEEEEEESGRTPWLLQRAINPRYKQASQHYHVIPFITTWAESAPLYKPSIAAAHLPTPSPEILMAGMV